MIRAAKSAVGRRRRRRGLAAAACVAAVVLLAALLPILPPAAAPAAAAAAPTAVKRPDRRVLPDGSAVELAAGAEYRLEFTATRRAVELLRGEALFTVRSDPDRPFIVAAGGVAVRAVGTEFAVRLGPEHVGVLVTEGRVAVDRPEAAAVPPTLVSAGNRLALASTAAADEPPPVPEPVAPAALATALAWRFQRVEFTATPLAEAVALMNAENVRQLALADAATGELRITGVFWTNDPAGFARLLESSLGLRTARRADGTLVLSR
jgi:transmembrane sensor